MFDHISLKVRNFEKSLAFYRAALAPLGYQEQELDETGKNVGFGQRGRVGLWLSEGTPSAGVHLAFKSGQRAQVEAFHEAAVQHGGTSHGEPGIRPSYAKDYYAAFVIDPDGNNVEAVVHEAEQPVYYIGSYDIVAGDRFRLYPPMVLALLPKYGGAVLASDTAAHLLEGTARTMNAIIRFPSKEAALGLYDDPAYQEAKSIRQSSTTNTSMVLASQFGR
jgi:uncharacterized protein (DUF1330 family)/catechol 2,3-dioxygenase-like lactoylglutathione lyase family enzyme